MSFCKLMKGQFLVVLNRPCHFIPQSLRASDRFARGLRHLLFIILISKQKYIEIKE